MSWILIISKGRSGCWNDKLLLPAQKPPGTLTKALPARRLQARTLCLGSSVEMKEKIGIPLHPLHSCSVDTRLLSLWIKGVLSAHKNSSKNQESPDSSQHCWHFGNPEKGQGCCLLHASHFCGFSIAGFCLQRKDGIAPRLLKSGVCGHWWTMQRRVQLFLPSLSLL